MYTMKSSTSRIAFCGTTSIITAQFDDKFWVSSGDFISTPLFLWVRQHYFKRCIYDLISDYGTKVSSNKPVHQK
jgi:hypothetical protein